MGRPIPVAVRRRIVAAWLRQKLTTAQLAARFGVSMASVTRLKRRFRDTESVSPRPHGGGPPRVIDAEDERLVVALVSDHPTWSEVRYAEELAVQHGIRASPATVGRVIRRLRLAGRGRAAPRRAPESSTEG